MADRLGIGDAFDGGFGDIGGDAGVLGGVAQAEQAQPRHQHDARQRIVHFRRRRAAFVAREVGLVRVDELLRRLLRGRLERVELACFRRRHDQRP